MEFGTLAAAEIIAKQLGSLDQRKGDRRIFLSFLASVAGSAALASCAYPETPPSPATSTQTSPSQTSVSVVERYLYLPFKEGSEHTITEGAIYSDEESSIHGIKKHNAVDFAVPYGTPVYAPCDGVAMTSYHTFWANEPGGGAMLYQGDPIRLGLGYFVQIRPEGRENFVQLAHLSAVEDKIPFIEPDFTPGVDSLIPKATDLLMRHNFITAVKRGELIGYSGHSGLAWGLGQQEYRVGAKRPVVLEKPIRSWDEPHVHFEVFIRNQSGGKAEQYDPYDIQSTREDYPYPDHPGKPMGPKALWVVGADGLPVFAA